MKGIAHLLLTILVPGVDHARFRIPHVQHPYMTVKRRAVLLCVFVEFPVDQLKRILLVS